MGLSVHEAILEFKKRVLIDLLNTIRKYAPKDRGQLVNSFRIKDNYVFSPLHYALFQELGTKPIRRLPFTPIAKWTRRKGLPAGAVWMSIRRRGIKPKRYIKQAIDEVLRRLEYHWRMAWR